MLTGSGHEFGEFRVITQQCSSWIFSCLERKAWSPSSLNFPLSMFMCRNKLAAIRTRAAAVFTLLSITVQLTVWAGLISTQHNGASSKYLPSLENSAAKSANVCRNRLQRPAGQQVVCRIGCRHHAFKGETLACDSRMAVCFLTRAACKKV